MLLAWWLRDPLIPYGGDTSRASEISADSVRADEAIRAREAALDALARAVRDTHARLVRMAGAALGARGSPKEAFSELRKLADSRHMGIVLVQGGEPVAWAGQIVAAPGATGPGTSVTIGEFYVSLQVVLEQGARRAIATSLIHADPPASEVADALDDELPERDLVDGFRFALVADSLAGDLITSDAGHPLVRVDATPLPGERVRFAAAAKARARGVIALALMVFIMIGIGWSDRRRPGRRLFTVGVAMAATALVPWNNFSNFSRAFDPAYFYTTALGPFTASAGAFIIFSALLLLAVIAVVRARKTQLSPVIAGAAAAFLAIAGVVAASAAATGIALPRWGSTTTLWLEWQLPVFLTLFACWLTASWLGRMTARKRPMISLRAAALIGIASGAIASFLVWNSTTEQRLQLAMRDVAGLGRADGETALLLTRFGRQLAAFDSAGSRADLLKRYAASDLAAAEVQVSLGLWDAAGTQYGALDLAPLRYDSLELAEAVIAVDSTRSPVVNGILGPTGRQLTLVAPHRSGEVTTVVASPRTRLVAPDPYAALLGFDQPVHAAPPYELTLTTLTARALARADAMTWRRHGSEWHGDQVVETSLGPARAHIEVDLRAWSTRLVRAALIVFFNLAVAGILWAFGAMAEGSFFRWVRRRSSRWRRSYRGRLTVALFTFFVVPAVAFAAWSYQRLRGDDREVRELLVGETLNSVAEQDDPTEAVRQARNATPLFIYSGAMLVASSDSLHDMIAPAGRMLPPPVFLRITDGGELTARWQQTVAGSKIFWRYRAAATPAEKSSVLAAPARSDETVLDRRRRDLTLLVLFATAIGGLAALWLSGIAARILARDLELSRIEVARAERVIAWGEMARQVAHEIKNPLTPIRLGVQHLKRARADNRPDFDRVLDENVGRILSEIDRLDETARTFSRYGSAPSELPPAERVDASAILRDVIGLERIGMGGVRWTLRGAEHPVFVYARGDELREVLLNVFENARLARARNVSVTLSRTEKAARVEVNDDGSGIQPGALPRVFEPHFSTRTRGSGLGLAISRRLLESWGGTIDLTSEEGRGARVVICLRALPA